VNTDYHTAINHPTTDRHSFSDVVKVENAQKLVDFLLAHHFYRYCVHRSRLQPFTSILLFTQPCRGQLTQPGHPSVGRYNQYRQ